MQKQEVKKYSFKISEDDVGILKAALIYYIKDQGFNNDVWYLIGGSIGTRDRTYEVLANGLLNELGELCGIDPDFGYWGKPGFWDSTFDRLLLTTEDNEVHRRMDYQKILKERKKTKMK